MIPQRVFKIEVVRGDGIGEVVDRFPFTLPFPATGERGRVGRLLFENMINGSFNSL